MLAHTFCIIHCCIHNWSIVQANSHNTTDVWENCQNSPIMNFHFLRSPITAKSSWPRDIFEHPKKSLHLLTDKQENQCICFLFFSCNNTINNCHLYCEKFYIIRQSSTMNLIINFFLEVFLSLLNNKHDQNYINNNQQHIKITRGLQLHLLCCML